MAALAEARRSNYVSARGLHGRDYFCPGDEMQGMTGIGMVVILMLFAVLSLGVAANGHSGVPYWGGLGFFVFCVGLCFYLVHLMTGEKRGRH